MKGNVSKFSIKLFKDTKTKMLKVTMLRHSDLGFNPCNPEFNSSKTSMGHYCDKDGLFCFTMFIYGLTCGLDFDPR